MDANATLREEEHTERVTDASARSLRSVQEHPGDHGPDEQRTDEPYRDHHPAGSSMLRRIVAVHRGMVPIHRGDDPGCGEGVAFVATAKEALDGWIATIHRG
jgi:hypothetical protein